MAKPNLARGVMSRLMLARLLQDYHLKTGCLAIDEFDYGTGFAADMFYLTASDYQQEFEIKTHKSDYDNDFKKSSRRWDLKLRKDITTNKHEQIEAGETGLKGFTFVLTEDVADKVTVPKYCGLMSARFYRGNKGHRCILTWEKRPPKLPGAKRAEDKLKSRIKRAALYRYMPMKIDRLHTSAAVKHARAKK